MATSPFVTGDSWPGEDPGTVVVLSGGKLRSDIADEQAVFTITGGALCFEREPGDDVYAMNHADCEPFAEAVIVVDGHSPLGGAAGGHRHHRAAQRRAALLAAGAVRVGRRSGRLMPVVAGLGGLIAASCGGDAGGAVVDRGGSSPTSSPTTTPRACARQELGYLPPVARAEGLAHLAAAGL